MTDPIIGTVQEGVVIETLPTVSADRKYVSLELTLARSEIVKPIQEFKTKLAGGSEHEVTIQIPEVQAPLLLHLGR